MKKKILFHTLLIFFGNSNAQTYAYLDANNANVMLRDDGIFFSDLANTDAAYEIPAQSGNKVAYASAFWITATDINDNLHAACNKYGYGDDFFPGPIANDYNTTYYTNTFGSAIWKVTRDQINYHIANYGNIGYAPDPSIANWPGNGNTAEGVAAQLAPYVDANDDQFYDPMDGDFPYIQGDAAVYIIMNDDAGIHTETGALPLGVEVHAVFYQFESTDDLNNTTFLHVKIYNRGTLAYSNFKFGLFLDTDIGNPMDDYIGCDSTRSLAYGYNGDGTDEPVNGQPGYGTNIPAFGAKFLNETAGAIMSFSSSGGAMGEPNLAVDYNHYMQANLLNGSQLMNGTNPTKFIYSGNPFTNTGWTETSAGNASGDRRILISSNGQMMGPADETCFDIAFVFNNETTNNLENVSELLNTADFVQNYYDNSIFPCNEIFLETVDQNAPLELTIFPNPSNGNFKIQISKPVSVSIYSITGELVLQEFEMTETRDLNLNLESGIYFVHIKSGDETATQKIIIY